MRGVVTEGGAAVLVDVPIPIPAEGHLLVRVQTCAVNRLDILQSTGKYPPPKDAGPVLGVEICGTIVSIGPGCRGSWVEGEQVIALVTGGGYAEFCVSDERTTWRNTWPELSLSQLCAIPEAMMTSYQLLFLVANVRHGETALLHAAASSIGQALIQMCVRKGVRVLATCRSPDKAALCARLGASEVIVTDSAGGGGFADKVKAATKGQGVQHVLCPVGDAYFGENLDSLAVDGRYTLYGNLSGSAEQPEQLGSGVLSRLLAKRIALLPSTLRGRSPDYKATLAAALEEDEDCGLSAIGNGDGQLKIEVDDVFSLESFAEAHAKMRSNSNTGKLCLTVTQTADAIEFFRGELERVQERYK